MKKILALIASPRKLGNCEIMAKEISRNIAEPHELQLLRLSDFDIQPCTACYTCLFKGKCVIDDGFHEVADAISAADALIVAAPTYFLGPNALLKLFLDRGLALYSYGAKIWGKPSVGIGIAGIPGKEGYTRLGIESFLKLMLADTRATRVIYGALPGEIFLNDANKKAAVELAAALSGQAAKTDVPCCPLCGGETFRFLGGEKIQCMLCSNSGTISMKDGQPVFSVERGEHEFFLTPEDAVQHGQWLVGMKSRFMEHKDALKKISVEYRRDGQWIRPEKEEKP